MPCQNPPRCRTMAKTPASRFSKVVTSFRRSDEDGGGDERDQRQRIDVLDTDGCQQQHTDHRETELDEVVKHAGKEHTQHRRLDCVAVGAVHPEPGHQVESRHGRCHGGGAHPGLNTAPQPKPGEQDGVQPGSTTLCVDTTRRWTCRLFHPTFPVTMFGKPALTKSTAFADFRCGSGAVSRGPSSPS